MADTSIKVSDAPRSIKAKDPGSEVGQLDAALRTWAREVSFAIRVLNDKLAKVGVKTTAAAPGSQAAQTQAAPAFQIDMGFSGRFADLSGKPTTLAGYGITDAQTKIPMTAFGLSLLSLNDEVELGRQLDVYVTVFAGEDLDSGDFVNISSGLAMKATASGGLPAQGFTREAVLLGAAVKVRASIYLNGFTALTVGTDYYLSDIVPGRVTATPPTAGFVQHLGVASDVDTLAVVISDPVFIS